MRAIARRRVITTVDELLDPVRSAQMQPMITRAGTLRAEFISVDLGTAMVESVEYSVPVVSKGRSVADRIGFIIPITRPESGRFNAEPVAPNAIYAYGESSVVIGTVSSASRFAVVALDREALERAAAELDVDLDLPARHEFRPVHGVDADSMRSLIRKLLDAVDDDWDSRGAEVSAGLVDALALALAAHQDANAVPTRSHTHSMSIASACVESAARTRYESTTMAELSEIAGVCERRVRRAFYDCYAMSPSAYLRVAALHGARAANSSRIRRPRTRSPAPQWTSAFGI